MDGSNLETFKRVIANFQEEDKIGRLKFFQEIFLVADTKFEQILRVIFLKISNTNVLFGEKFSCKRFILQTRPYLLLRKCKL